MGLGASYVIVEKGAAAAFHDPWGALGCTLVLADGPGACRNLAQGAVTITALTGDAAAGFLLDFDTRRAIVFGAPRLAPTDDLPAELRAQVAAMTAALAEGPAEMFELVSPHWPGWTLVWDARGAEAFAEHLFDRRITSIETSALAVSEGAPVEVVVPSAAVQASLALADQRVTPPPSAPPAAPAPGSRRSSRGRARS